MNTSGRNTAASEIVIDMIVKLISFELRSVASYLVILLPTECGFGVRTFQRRTRRPRSTI